MWVGEHSAKEIFERMKNAQGRLLENVKAYKMEQEKLEKKLLEKEVGMKAMTLSAVHLERNL